MILWRLEYAFPSWTSPLSATWDVLENSCRSLPDASDATELTINQIISSLWLFSTQTGIKTTELFSCFTITCSSSWLLRSWSCSFSCWSGRTFLFLETNWGESSGETQMQMNLNNFDSTSSWQLQCSTIICRGSGYSWRIVLWLLVTGILLLTDMLVWKFYRYKKDTQNSKSSCFNVIILTIVEKKKCNAC